MNKKTEFILKLINDISQNNNLSNIQKRVMRAPSIKAIIATTKGEKDDRVFEKWKDYPEALSTLETYIK